MLRTKPIKELRQWSLINFNIHEYLLPYGDLGDGGLNR